MRGLLLALLLVAPLGALAGSRFHERNHTGLLALFGFDDGQLAPDFKPTTARDFTGRGLLGNLTTSTTAITWSPNRVGFTIPSAAGGNRAISQLDTSALLAELTDEFSVEFFLTSPTNLIGDVHIAGFGNTISCDGGWNMYSAHGNSIRVRATMTYNGNPMCLQLAIVATHNALRHGVLRARDGEYSLRSHGGQDGVIDQPVAFDPSLWSNFARLTFAAPSGEAWKGSILMIAFYNRFLSDEEVATNQELGPPNSWPVASAAALSVTEDLASTLVS